MSFPRYPRYKDSGVQGLGDVPEHWKIAPLKTVSTHNDEVLDESTAPDAEIAYVDISSVDAVSGIKTTETVQFSAAPSRARRRVRHGDVIVSTVRTYLKAIARIREPAENLIVSTGFAVIRPRDELWPAFLGYLVSASYFVDQVISRSTGVSYPAINASELVAIPVTVPPLAEQIQIAELLDRETAKIDELVAEQQRLMDLLKEKRHAVVSHAVTKGLNPDAPIKSSSIAWLGDMPMHWEVRHLRRLIEKGTTITYGIVQAGPDIEGGIPYIRTSDMAGESLPESGYLRTTPEIDASYVRSKVKADDLVVAIRASLGKGLLVPKSLEGANLTQGTARICPGPMLLPRFLFWSFNSKYCQTSIQVVAKGTTFLEITLDALRRIEIAVPPVTEQAAIIAHLDSITAKLDALVAEAQRAVDLLQERRIALISAAVTGQVDVRAFAEREAA